jgi:hypothetical protein
MLRERPGGSPAQCWALPGPSVSQTGHQRLNMGCLWVLGWCAGLRRRERRGGAGGSGEGPDSATQAGWRWQHPAPATAPAPLCLAWRGALGAGRHRSRADASGCRGARP